VAAWQESDDGADVFVRFYELDGIGAAVGERVSGGGCGDRAGCHWAAEGLV